MIEAPRGTPFYHYFVDEHGSIEKANLIIASGQNNQAMKHAVTQVAKQHVRGKELEVSMLNKVEAAVRCYDPCPSCSTHTLGQMPLRVQLFDAENQLQCQISR